MVGTAGPEFAIEDMLFSRVFGHPVTELSLVETHVSWIVLTGAFAYKVKKPVRLDFIDCSSLQQRKHLCEEELRLNQRFAPQLYLAVVPISRTGVGLCIGAGGEPVEFAVRMRQFDRSEELSALLARRDVSTARIGDFARFLAGFHGRAPVAGDDAPFGDYEQVREVVLKNFSALRAAAGQFACRPQWDELDAWNTESLARLRGVMERRKRCGAVRECHGDLHARNIVRWQGALLPFDCLEFDPALRWIDTANEIAFLYMDLLGYGRPDLASELVSRYLEVSGDYEALRVLNFYAVCRALVRAKIDALSGAGAIAAAACAARLDLARRLTQQSDPVLYLMHGVSGSGKSWLSERLVSGLSGIRVRADLERKRLAGIGALDRPAGGGGGDLYGAEFSIRTYARLAECAEHALAGGCNVIVDGAGLRAAEREPFMDIARRFGRRFVVLACTAEAPLLRSRLLARAAAGSDPSDADTQVLERQLASIEPFTEAERRHVLQIDTTALEGAGPMAEVLRRVTAIGSCEGSRPAAR